MEVEHSVEHAACPICEKETGRPKNLNPSPPPCEVRSQIAVLPASISPGGRAQEGCLFGAPCVCLDPKHLVRV